MSARIFFFFGRGPRLSQNASTHGVVNRAPSMEVRRENPLLGRVLEGICDTRSKAAAPFGTRHMAFSKPRGPNLNPRGTLGLPESRNQNVQPTLPLSPEASILRTRSKAAPKSCWPGRTKISRKYRVTPKIYM